MINNKKSSVLAIILASIIGYSGVQTYSRYFTNKTIPEIPLNRIQSDCVNPSELEVCAETLNNGKQELIFSIKGEQYVLKYDKKEEKPILIHSYLEDVRSLHP